MSYHKIYQIKEDVTAILSILQSIAEYTTLIWVSCDDQQFPTEAGWYAIRMPGNVRSVIRWTTTEDGKPVDEEEGAPNGGWGYPKPHVDCITHWCGPLVVPSFTSK